MYLSHATQNRQENVNVVGKEMKEYIPILYLYNYILSILEDGEYEHK